MSSEARAEFDEALNEPDPVPSPEAPIQSNGRKPPPWFRQGKAGVQASLLAAKQLGITTE